MQKKKKKEQEKKKKKVYTVIVLFLNAIHLEGRVCETLDSDLESGLTREGTVLR